MRTSHVRMSSRALAMAAALVAAAPAAAVAQLPTLPTDSGAVAFEWSVLAGPALGARFGEPPSTALGANWRMRGTGFGVRAELLYSGARSTRNTEWVRAGLGPELTPCPGCSLALRSDHIGFVASLGYEFRTGSRLRPYVLTGAGLHHGWLATRSVNPDMIGDVTVPGCTRGLTAMLCRDQAWNGSFHAGAGLALRIGDLHLLGELRMEEFADRGVEMRPLVGIRF